MDIRNKTSLLDVPAVPAPAVSGESDAVLQGVATRYLGLGLGLVAPSAASLLNPPVTTSLGVAMGPGSQRGLDGALAAFSLDVAVSSQVPRVAASGARLVPSAALAGLFPVGSDLGATAAGLSGSPGSSKDSSGIEGWGMGASPGDLNQQIKGRSSEALLAGKWSGAPALAVVNGVADNGAASGDFADEDLLDEPGIPEAGPGLADANPKGGVTVATNAGVPDERRIEVPGLPDRPTVVVDTRGAKVFKGDVFEALAEWGRLETSVRGSDRFRGNSLDVLLLPDLPARVRAARASRGLRLGLLGGFGGEVPAQGPLSDADLITRTELKFFNRRVHRVLRKDPRDQRKKKGREGDAGEGLSQDGEITSVGGI